MKPSQPRGESPVLPALAALVLAVAQYRLVSLIFGPDYRTVVEAARGVVLGTPHWQVYQSRILAPYTVGWLANFTGDFYSAHVIFMIGCTALAGWLLFRLAGQSSGRAAGWNALFLFHLLFALLLSKFWLYAWDHYSIVFFVLFISFVVRERSWIAFTTLFGAAILNRESAFFIALWMVLDSPLKVLLARIRNKPNVQLNWRMMLAGALCFPTGYVLIQQLRESLLIHETGPEIFNLPHAGGQTVHLQLETNWAFTKIAFSLAGFGTHLIPIVIWMGAIVMAALVAFRQPERYLGLSLSHLALTLSIALFGLLPETRILLELVPFMVFGVTVLLAEAPRFAAATMPMTHREMQDAQPEVEPALE